jgi:uncharacterized protein
MAETVVVLGASPNPDRYSYRALRMLKEYGHTPIPVNPGHDEIDGVPVVRRLDRVSRPIDTVTMYVGPERGRALREEIAGLAPRRVIFNPGSEDPETERFLRERGIEVVEGCTLVMLRSNTF